MLASLTRYTCTLPPPTTLTCERLDDARRHRHSTTTYPPRWCIGASRGFGRLKIALILPRSLFAFFERCTPELAEAADLMLE
jgi:hypothetical protein